MRRQYAHEQPDADEIDLYEKLLSRALLLCLLQGVALGIGLR